MANNTSPHILGTASNLLGFCLFVITAVHFTNNAEASIIDEVTSVISVALISSCVFSFFSIRTSDVKRERLLEKTAEYFFISALAGVFIIILLILLNYTD